MYKTTLEHEGVTYYGWYNSQQDYLRSQFYVSEEECDKYVRTNDPSSPKWTTREMIERSVEVLIENDYGKGVYYEVLFDPVLKLVVYNHRDTFQYDSDEISSAKNKTMKEYALYENRTYQL